VQFPGYNLLIGANLPNSGTMFVSLDEFKTARIQKKSAKSIMGQLYARFGEFGMRVSWSAPPPVRGLGSVAGFK